MPKKNLKIWIRAALIALSAVILISVPMMASNIYTSAEPQEDEFAVLSIWQIDSFEGGKGSRAGFLQSIGEEFSKGCYVNVTSLTAAAARENLKNGNTPDLISYGAGAYGFESYIYGKTPYYSWAHGGYCFLTLNESADFSDISAENTVINSGVDNFSGAAALFCGVSGAAIDKPTGAYVQLINGKFKYLLGTQRDIFRLKTRGVAFKVKPVTEFNDLYQNISITTENAQRQALAEKFIEKLISSGEELSRLGLLSNGQKLYDDEMSAMEGLEYDIKLTTPISESAKRDVENAISSSDINKLKNLLK